MGFYIGWGLVDEDGRPVRLESCEVAGSTLDDDGRLHVTFVGRVAPKPEVIEFQVQHEGWDAELVKGWVNGDA